MVKIFSDGKGNAKIKRTKLIRIVNANVVWGCLSENYLTQKFITRNIHDLQWNACADGMLNVCL